MRALGWGPHARPSARLAASANKPGIHMCQLDGRCPWWPCKQLPYTCASESAPHGHVSRSSPTGSPGPAWFPLIKHLRGQHACKERRRGGLSVALAQSPSPPWACSSPSNRLALFWEGAKEGLACLALGFPKRKVSGSLHEPRFRGPSLFPTQPPPRLSPHVVPGTCRRTETVGEEHSTAGQARGGA